MLIVVAMILSSCQAATVEEKEGQTVTGKVTEKDAPKVEEEKEETIVEEEEGLEMVLDVKGRLVEKPQYGGTINITSSDDPRAWDGFMHLDGGVDYNVMSCVYDTLWGGDWSVDRSEYGFTGLYVPQQYSRGYSAESWENPDPKTYIIHIRQGMKFQDKPPVNGREVVADDFKWSFDRILGLGDFADAGSANVGFSSWDVVESIEVVDNYTFILHLKEPSPLLPEYFGTEICPWVQPHEVVDTYGNDFSWDQAVGHGPWQITDYTSGSSLFYDKHPNYYGWDDNFPNNQIPYADHLKILIIVDRSTVLAALRTGKIDQILHANPEEVNSLQDSNPEIVWKKTPNVARAFRINNSKKPYSDIRVRKAMQMAINLEELAEGYYNGTADPHPQILNEMLYPNLTTPFDDMPEDVQEAFTYNPEGARALLAEAGYPNGFQQTLEIANTSSTEYYELADLFSEYCRAIGIETEISVREYADYVSYTYSGQQQICIHHGYGGYWMPMQVLTYHYGGQEETPWNYSNVDDPFFNELIDTIFAEPDPAERDRMTKEANLYGTSQFWDIVGPVQVNFRFWNPWFKGYSGENQITAVSRGPVWARVWIDQDLKYEMTGKRD